MKLKKVSWKLLVCLILTLLVGVVFTACNNDAQEEKLFDYIVTFNYNEGNLTDEPKDQQFLGVMKNGLVSIRPGYDDSSFAEGEFERYYVEGWYLPQLDSNGKVKTDKNKFVLLDKEWDFQNDRVKGNMTLYAKLAVMPRLVYVYAYTDADGNEVEEEVGYMQEKPGIENDKPESKRYLPKKEGYTFLGNYYKTKEMDEEFEWPYLFEEGADEKVYVDMIEGNWDVVNTEADFISKLQGGRNIYLNSDLNFEGKAIWGAIPYNGILNGANHTIKNVTRVLEASGLNDGENCGGIFGALGALAKVYDITFENVSVTYTVHTNSLTAVGLKVGMLAWEASNGAEIKNVKFVNAVLNYEPHNGGVEAFKGIANNSAKDEDIVGLDISGVTIVASEDDEEE